jgi:hypothetical protein
MNDNEIVLNLLDFYKKKGIDLYRVLDDASFKSLSLNSKLNAIQLYAKKIISGTPSGWTKSDFKGVMKDALGYGAMGAAAGAFTSVGAAALYNEGKVPWDAYVNGAIIGGIGGATGKIFDMAMKMKDRHLILNELHNVAEDPTPGNALNVLTMNNLKTDPEVKGKILDKIRGKVDSNIEHVMDDRTRGYTERYNEEVLKNTKR